MSPILALLSAITTKFIRLLAYGVFLDKALVTVGNNEFTEASYEIALCVVKPGKAFNHVNYTIRYEYVFKTRPNFPISRLSSPD